MIMIFTPTYFSPQHRYCAREFAAMIEIERRRRSAFGIHGLIIPVVLRAPDELPDSIRQNRQFYRFEKYSVSGPQLIKNATFDAEIQKMAQYIAARTRELGDETFDCAGFQIPGDNDVDDLLRIMTSRPTPFPGRERPL
jgi:hypothetical protein